MYNHFKNSRFIKDRSASAYTQFLAWHEGIEGVEDDCQDDSIARFFQATEGDEALEESRDNERFYSSFFMNSICADAHKVTALLVNTAVLHRLTKEDPFAEQKQEPPIINFVLES